MKAPDRTMRVASRTWRLIDTKHLARGKALTWILVSRRAAENPNQAPRLVQTIAGHIPATWYAYAGQYRTAHYGKPNGAAVALKYILKDALDNGAQDVAKHAWSMLAPVDPIVTKRARRPLAQLTTDKSGHGLACPSCDDGTLLMQSGADDPMKVQGCDSCGYKEEVR